MLGGTKNLLNLMESLKERGEWVKMFSESKFGPKCKRCGGKDRVRSLTCSRPTVEPSCAVTQLEKAQIFTFTGFKR